MASSTVRSRIPRCGCSWTTVTCGQQTCCGGRAFRNGARHHRFSPFPRLKHQNFRHPGQMQLPRKLPVSLRAPVLLLPSQPILRRQRRRRARARHGAQGKSRLSRPDRQRTKAKSAVHLGSQLRCDRRKHQGPRLQLAKLPLAKFRQARHRQMRRDRRPPSPHQHLRDSRTRQLQAPARRLVRLEWVPQVWGLDSARRVNPLKVIPPKEDRRRAALVRIADRWGSQPAQGRPLGPGPSQIQTQISGRLQWRQDNIQPLVALTRLPRALKLHRLPIRVARASWQQPLCCSG